MLLSRRARELTLSVVLFAVPVVLLYGNIGQTSQLNPVDRGVLRVAGGLQRLVRGGIEGTADLWSRNVALWNLEARNADLRHRNYELRENNRILRLWAERGRELETRLGFAVSPPLATHPADVVGRRLSPFFQVVRVRVRPGPPPRLGQAVGVPAGLLGRVHRVSGPYADVLLLSDTQSRVKVQVKRTASRGELHGTGSPGLLAGRVEYLSARDRVQPGDLLLTSGMEGRFPADLPVGRVLRVGKRFPSRYQEVEVVLTAGDTVPRLLHLLRSSRRRRPAAAPAAKGSR